MPPKKFEGKFGIPEVPSPESTLTASLYHLDEDVSLEVIERMSQTVVEKLQSDYEITLTPSQVLTLQTKFARFLQYNPSSTSEQRIAKLKQELINIVDALAETPRFLDGDSGGIDKLLEIHQVKSYQKRAERRRHIALRVGDEEYNPYENLFETNDGHYYVARLLNKAHLEDESDYLKHCVGEDDKPYIRKVVNGGIEIFSFRSKETGDPIWTIEYDRKSKRILQIEGVRSNSSSFPSYKDDTFSDLIQSLEMLQTTEDDTGKKREIKNQYIKDMKQLSDVYTRTKANPHIGLDRSELLFLYEIDASIESFGERDPRIEEIKSTRNRQEDIQSLCNCPPEHIAHDFTDITTITQVYCEDTGKKIIIVDFREDKNKSKLPQLVELAAKIKESGSPARPDMSYEGGMVTIDVPLDAVKDRATAFESYEQADNNGLSGYIWPVLHEMTFTPPDAQLEFVILSYNKDPNIRTSSKKIIEDADKLGLRPATFAELVTLGIVMPDFNKRSEYLVGLGTEQLLDGMLWVPCLRWDGDERSLDAVRCDSVWGERDRFLFVCK